MVGWGQLSEADRASLEATYAAAGLDLQGLMKQVCVCEGYV